MVVIELTDEEAELFKEFRRRYDVIAPLVGYMDSMNILDLKNMNIVIDINQEGIVAHMAVTRHYRR
jgi:ArsR family metal-binding transcriptional regulator